MACSCHWYSEAITQTGQKKFSPEFKCLFDECRFYPEDTIFAARFTHVWKGIYLNIPAPNKILKIGSWQGASAVILTTLFSDVHITCIDTWQGSDSLDISNDSEKNCLVLIPLLLLLAYEKLNQILCRHCQI